MKDILNKFNELNRDQFIYGGQKYQNSETKEATDCLFDIYGFKWLIGTINKYVHRTKNLARERDILKIACYQFIVWLKRGFFNNKSGVKEPVNTTVKIKNEHFPDFVILINNYYESNKFYFEHLSIKETLEKIENILVSFANEGWLEISQEKILHLYCLSFTYWHDKYYINNKAGQDTDTYNETRTN